MHLQLLDLDLGWRADSEVWQQTKFTSIENQNYYDIVALELVTPTNDGSGESGALLSEISVASMHRKWPQRGLRQMAVVMALLLLAGGAISQTSSAASPPNLQGAYVIVNPLNGRVISLDPETTVVLNVETGQIVRICNSEDSVWCLTPTRRLIGSSKRRLILERNHAGLSGTQTHSRGSHIIHEFPSRVMSSHDVN